MNTIDREILDFLGIRQVSSADKEAFSDWLIDNLYPQGINGHRAPIVGSVSMNTVMIDVTDLPEVKSGDFRMNEPYFINNTKQFVIMISLFS
ncbi:hypothetical protein SAMN05421784_10785 [Xenorhabdus koppenhoeferi]|uniref:Alanine racemase C-terminal domain-containing protein n=1 Tax=Xenorhabdus koppenhoeferi TaxID=351659 RepID=A0A1I7G9L0_9GAMM|nr:alanine racemase C-terminal domain-containing protein [Xenorhabdus koppenhoeferi]SFU45117.1 hypothetical protein SAMN05421784_10785 [Xenorhabdus koppenhoeferi]